MGFRWSLARTLNPIIEECCKGGLSPHIEVLRLFEIQFSLRQILTRFNDELAFKQQSIIDMTFDAEVAAADAAITEATQCLLSLPPATRRRSSLCLIKSMCNPLTL